MSFVITEPYQFIAGLDGEALDAGSIYYGQPNLDPVSNPKTVYYDVNMTIPAPQPLRTVNGYVVRNGSPTFLFASGNYSILVLDKHGRQVYFVPDFMLIGNAIPLTRSQISAPVANIAALKALDKTQYSYAQTSGYYAAGDGGSGLYWYDASDTISADNGGTIIVATDGGRWKLQYTGAVSIKQFGAKGDGIANDTPAVQSALNTLRNISVPDGTYLIDTVFFPNSTSDASPLGGKFIGTPNAIFIQRTGNTALFKKIQTAGRAYNWEIGPFCVKPTTGASSTVSAIFTSGFTSCIFNHIQGLSNGTAGFWAIFDLSASPYLSYFNTFNQTTLEGQQGYTKAFHFNNNGAGTLFNANAETINQPNIYNNTGLVIAIDCVDSYAVTINQPYIEANAGCLAVNMGTNTVVIGGAIEANGNDFGYPDNRAQWTTVQGVYLATAHTTTFGAGALNNLWINVVEAGGNTWAFVNSPDASSNRKIQMRKSETPNAPSLTYVSGGTGVITNVSTNVVSPLDPLIGEVTYRLQYQFAASGTTTTKVALSALVQTGGTPPFVIKSISWGAITSGGVLTPSAVDVDGGVYFVPPSATAILINCFVTFKQPL